MDFVLIERGLLQTAINMLRRDAAQGRVVRGELADEIERNVRQAGESVAPIPAPPSTEAPE